MRFDWYQTTILDDPSSAIDTIKKLGHELRQCDGLAKAYRYQQGWQVLHRESGLAATIMAGGNHGTVHAFASSDSTDAFVDLMRSEYQGRHLVTRMDAAQDFYDQGAFVKLRRTCKRVATAHRLGFQGIQDRLNPHAGRTQYIGSKKSDHFGRLYEKGWEVANKCTAAFPGFNSGMLSTVFDTSTGQDVKPEDWVRLELQVRPQGEQARTVAAEATPEQAWGFTSWSHELAKEALELDLERIYIRARKISKDEESLRWMCKQYGAMLGRMQADYGDWACVGLEVGKIIKEQAKS